MVGEFQKRIDEHFTKYGKWCYSALGPQNNAEAKGGVDRMKVFIDDVVDEAKKEFPKREKFPYETSVDVVEDNYHRWFEEWFINGKKKE